MAKLLLVTADLLGTLYPAVELARRLDRAGHQVTLAGFDNVRPIVEGQGVSFEPIDRGRFEEFLAEDARASYVDRLRHLARRRRRAIESLSLTRLEAVTLRLNPDLVLIDGELHEQIIALAAGGWPIALLNSFVSIWRHPGLPPPHCLARPGVGWKGSSAGCRLLWSVLRLRKWGRALRQRLGRVGCDRLSVLRSLAHERGFDLRREADVGQWLKPFTYQTMPVLSLHALEFEFSHLPLVRVRYVGPMPLHNRSDPRITESSRDRLEAIRERCRNESRTLIFAGFGSFFTAERDLVDRLIEAVASRDDWELILSLGGRADPADFGRVPTGVHIFAWVDQPEVLRYADVAVIHGGINTVDECVLAGVPMLIYCGFETDMGGITSRVLHHGLGLAGDGERDGALQIRRRIEKLLGEPRFRQRIEEFRGLYQAYERDRVAERAIDEILADSCTRSGA